MKSLDNLENGKIVGARKIYYKDGSLFRDEYYINNLLEGWVKMFSANGVLSKEEYYSSGILQRSRDYDAKGNLVSSKSF